MLTPDIFFSPDCMQVLDQLSGALRTLRVRQLNQSDVSLGESETVILQTVLEQARRWSDDILHQRTVLPTPLEEIELPHQVQRWVISLAERADPIAKLPDHSRPVEIYKDPVLRSLRDAISQIGQVLGQDVTKLASDIELISLRHRER